MAHGELLVMMTVNKHKIAGIVVIVVGAVVAVFGALQAMRRTSGAALISLAGVAVAVIGILVFTRTIHG